MLHVVLVLLVLAVLLALLRALLILPVLVLTVTLVVGFLQLFGQPVGLPVGRGGVKEQQVDLEVKQVRDGEEHPLLQRLKRRVQEVHRPIARVIGHLG